MKNNRWILLAAFILLFSMQMSHASSVSVPSGIKYYVPLTLSNPWSSVPSDNYLNYIDQMVNLSESNTIYGNYIAFSGNTANFEFFYQNGTIIPAWIESNSSGKLIVWLDIKNTTDSFYLGFAGKTTNLLSSSGTSGIGEAPQLSSTYAEYDDGVSVFPFYYNFEASTSSLYLNTSGSAPTINNGISLPSYTSAAIGTFGGVAYNSNLFTSNSPYVVDADVEASTGTTGSYYVPIIVVWNSSANFANKANNVLATITYGEPSQVMVETANDPEVFYDYNTGWYVPAYNYDVVSLLINSTNVSAELNYSDEIKTNYVPYNYTTHFGLGESNSTGVTINAYWLRARAYPPNGIMPSVIFGQVQSTEPKLTISPNPATYGNTITVSANCVVQGSTCDIDYPTLGNVIASGTQTATYAFNAFALGAGTYSSFYANDITNNENSAGETLTVSKNSTYQFSITTSPTSSFAYNGLEATGAVNLVTHNSQLTANVFVGNAFVASSNSIASFRIGSNAGNYIITANTLGNANYTSNSISETFTIAKATPELTLNVCNSYVYNGINCTITGSISSFDNQLTANVEINGVLVANTASTFSYNAPAKTGSYTIIFDTNGNANYNPNTEENGFGISEATPDIELHSCNGYTYNGINCTVTASIHTYNNQLIGQFTVNGRLISSTNSILTYNAPATAGPYTFELQTNGNANYTSNQASNELIISKAEPDLTLVLPQNTVYGPETPNVIFGINTINNQLTANIIVNNEVLPLAISRTYHFTLGAYSPAGTYTFTENTIGNQNYTSNSITGSFTIAKATPELTLNVCNSHIYNGSNCTVTGDISTNANQLLGNLYVNGNLVANAIGAFSYNAPAAAGEYSFTFNTVGNGNYISNSIEGSFIISKAVPKISIPSLNLPYDGNKYFANVSILTINNQLAANAFVDNSLILSFNSIAKVPIGTLAGNYIITANTLGNANYTAFEASNTINIYQPPSHSPSYSTISLSDNINNSFVSNVSVFTVYLVNQSNGNVAAIDSYYQQQLPAQITIPPNYHANISFACAFSTNTDYYKSSNTYGLLSPVPCGSNYTAKSGVYTAFYTKFAKPVASTSSITTTTSTTTISTTTTISPQTIEVGKAHTKYSALFNISAAKPIKIDFKNMNTALYIFTKNANLTALNFTVSNYTGLLPSLKNHIIERAIQVNFTPASKATIFANISIPYNCSSSYPTDVYLYSNGSFIPFANYTLLSQACTVEVHLKSDPIVALYLNITKPAPTSSVPTTTTASTTEPQKIVTITHPNKEFAYIAVIIAIAIVAIIAYVIFSKRKGNGHSMHGKKSR